MIKKRRNNMKRKGIIMGAMLVGFIAGATAPVFAESGIDVARFEKLEERTRDLEARLAKVEAWSHKQMGMMQHEHGMQDKGMGANNPMGQAPQPAPQQNPGMGGGMPQGGATQPQGGGMPAGGMGDM